MGTSCAALGCNNLRTSLGDTLLEESFAEVWPKLTSRFGQSWPTEDDLKGPLTLHFEADYLDGKPFKGDKYLHVTEQGQGELEGPDVLEHVGSGIKAWDHALDLRAAAPQAPFVVLYHYTGRDEFRNIVDGRRLASEVVASLADRRGDFGSGMRTTSKEPEAFGTQNVALLHTCWPTAWGDEEKASGAEANILNKGNTFAGPEDARNAAVCEAILADRQRTGLAAYCIPILVPKEFAFNIWQRTTPDLMGKAGLGCNRWGQRQFLGRNVWMVQFSRDGKGQLHTATSLRNAAVLEARITHLQLELGECHIDTIAAISSLATLLETTGRASEAESILRRTLALQQSVLGGQHLVSLAVAARLAALLAKEQDPKDQQDGKRSEAVQLWRLVLSGYAEQLGPSHLSTIQSTNSLAVLLADLGMRPEAEDLVREALRGCREMLEPKHPATLRSSQILARLLLDSGNVAVRSEAEALARLAYNGHKELLGPKHPWALASGNTLAGVLIATEQHAEATPLCERLMAGCEAALGSSSSEFLRSASHLALTLEAVGKLAQAEPLARLAYAGAKEAFGLKHERTFAASQSLAKLLVDMGKASEAEPLCQRALAHHEESSGASHPVTLMAAQNLAEALLECGKVEEAETLFRRALAGFSAKLGSKHTTSLTCAAFLASLLEQTSRLAEAEMFYQRALMGFEETLGPSHNYTLAAADSLANCLTAMGRKGEAKQLHRFIRDMAAEVLAKERAAVGADVLPKERSSERSSEQSSRSSR